MNVIYSLKAKYVEDIRLRELSRARLVLAIEGGVEGGVEGGAA